MANHSKTVRFIQAFKVVTLCLATSSGTQALSLLTYRCWHGCEAESFIRQELSEDINHIIMFSIHCILLKLHNILPVLQSNADLQSKTFTKKH